MFQTCVLPTLLYGAENWILNDSNLCQLEKFQAEIGRRILHLSKHHSHRAVLVALGWPSMRARILNVKLGFLCRLLSSLFSHCSIATETFKTLTKVDVFNLSIVQQCLFLDAYFGTNAVATILNNGDGAMCVLKQLKNEILKKDREIILRETSSHTSVSLAATVNWLRVWEEVREKAPTGLKSFNNSLGSSLLLYSVITIAPSVVILYPSRYH